MQASVEIKKVLNGLHFTSSALPVPLRWSNVSVSLLACTPHPPVKPGRAPVISKLLLVVITVFIVNIIEMPHFFWTAIEMSHCTQVFIQMTFSLFLVKCLLYP